MIHLSSYRAAHNRGRAHAARAIQPSTSILKPTKQTWAIREHAEQVETQLKFKSVAVSPIPLEGSLCSRCAFKKSNPKMSEYKGGFRSCQCQNSWDGTTIQGIKALHTGQFFPSDSIAPRANEATVWSSSAVYNHHMAQMGHLTHLLYEHIQHMLSSAEHFAANISTVPEADEYFDMVYTYLEGHKAYYDKIISNWKPFLDKLPSEMVRLILGNYE